MHWRAWQKNGATNVCFFSQNDVGQMPSTLIYLLEECFLKNKTRKGAEVKLSYVESFHTKVTGKKLQVLSFKRVSTHLMSYQNWSKSKYAAMYATMDQNKSDNIFWIGILCEFKKTEDEEAHSTLFATLWWFFTTLTVHENLHKLHDELN